MHLHVCCTAGPIQPRKITRPQPRVVGMKAHHLPACKKNEQRRRVNIFWPGRKRIEMKGHHLLACRKRIDMKGHLQACRKMNRKEETTPFAVNSLRKEANFILGCPLPRDLLACKQSKARWMCRSMAASLAGCSLSCMADSV